MAGTTSIYLREAQVSDLARLAAERGYTQTRGPGAKKLPSVSQLVSALGAGELVAVGPVPRWRAVTSALHKALAVTQLDDDEREALECVLRQIQQDANFDDDDI